VYGLSNHRSPPPTHVRDSWIVDSGAAAHITNSTTGSLGLRATNYSVVVASGAKTPAAGVGDYRLEFDLDGRPTMVTLKDVLYVPTCPTSLFSLSRATAAGAKVHFDGDTCVIADGKSGHATLVGKRTPDTSGLWCLRPRAVAVAAMQATASTTSAVLWHRRYGHLHWRNLEALVRNNMVSGLPLSASDFKAAETSLPLCEPCATSKQTSASHPANSVRASAPLDLVHSDICGPIEVESLGGSQYFVTLLDDFSSLAQVAYIRRKSDADAALRGMLAMWERSTGRKVKALRSDRGGEYLSKDFSSYLRAAGIQHEPTAPYSPEQNGRAERLNRTLQEKVRAMLIDSGLPRFLWAEALETAVYLHNRSPTSASATSTPYELFTGTKPDVSHLRIFGSTCYVLTPPPKRSGKLTPTSTKGAFVGYTSTAANYKVYIPGRRSIVITHDVRFDEPKGALETVGAAPTTPAGEPSPTPTGDASPPPASPPLAGDASTVEIRVTTPLAPPLAPPIQQRVAPPLMPEVAVPLAPPSPLHPAPPQVPAVAPPREAPAPALQQQQPAIEALREASPHPARPPGYMPRDNPLYAGSPPPRASPSPAAGGSSTDASSDFEDAHEAQGSAHSSPSPAPSPAALPQPRRAPRVLGSRALAHERDGLDGRYWGANSALAVELDGIHDDDEPSPSVFALAGLASLNETVDVPRNYKEAMRSPQAAQWKAACDEEMASLIDNNTWEITPAPSGSIIGSRWVFALKRGPDGEVVRYKARLVALAKSLAVTTTRSTHLWQLTPPFVR